jgi:acetyltransferase-like isoleucine patch superfamily enzyme
MMSNLRLTRTKSFLRRIYAPAKVRQVFHAASRVEISDGTTYLNGRFAVGRDSSLVIEAGVTIDSDIEIGESCEVKFRRDSCLRNTIFVVSNGSVVELCPGAIVDSPVMPRSGIFVDNGSLRLSDCAHVMSSDVSVRFGGRMSVGKYTGIAYGSELRCEEQLDIGAYGMISYGVCIYDTNSHSTDWQLRRERIERSYPAGVTEEVKPATSAVQIGDDVWIGKQATITKGTIIGNRCIIGIRATVAGDSIPDDSIVVVSKPRVIARKVSQLECARGGN